ncbi:pyocin knob domain-containing protein [Frischella perrara]|uniref:pyocin knob domain-containing protein n=1 Tax=Frischella perrara TaxID=1267021 RepID=UPI0023F53559|nr:pyocin knob domain-containing protein [Frischella perrara]
MKQKFYKTPFAENGDKAEIAEKTTSDGTVSYQEGWSVDYQRDMEIDKNAKAVERDVMNGILNDITSNIKQYQTMAFPEFITSEDNDGTPFLYTAGTVVSYRQNETEDFKNYVSLVDNNSSTPGEDSEKWQEFIFAEATYNEIKNGTSKTKMITPRRLKKATEELEEKISETLKIDNNLSDLNDVETARNNLGLGDLAKKDALNADDVGAFPVTSHFLDDTINLDDVTSNGVHSQNVNSNATFANNYPIEEAGSLIVIKNGVDATSCRQIYLPYNSTSEFRRYGLGSPIVWSLWEEKKIAGPKLELKKVSDLPNADDIKPDDLVMVVQDKDGVLTSSKSTTEAMKTFFNTGVVKSINGDIPDEQGNINVKTGIDEAPDNGFSYIRKNKKWVSTNENVIESEYIIDARFSADDCTDLILDFRHKNIFNLIPWEKWEKRESGFALYNYTEGRLERKNVEIRPPKEGRVIMLFDGSEGDWNRGPYKTVAVYFGVGVKVLLSKLHLSYDRRKGKDDSHNFDFERNTIGIFQPRVMINELSKSSREREWTNTKIEQMTSDIVKYRNGEEYNEEFSNFYIGTERIKSQSYFFIDGSFSFLDYKDDDDMSVNLSTKLKKLIEDLKIPYHSSAILLNDYLTPYIKTCVSVYDKTVNGEITPVFRSILQKNWERTTPHYNCNIYQYIKGSSIYFSENNTLIFPTDVEDYAWALVYWASKNGEDYNKLPYSPSFTYEDIKFADKDDPIKTYFNLVLINKNTLKPVKLAEFKQWVLEKRDEYLKQVPSTSTDQYFDLAFPAIYYDGTFRFTCHNDKNGTEYCRILYLDIPDSVDAFSLMSRCDKLSYVNPQTVVPELTFISKDINPNFNEYYNNEKFSFKFNFTAPMNNDYIGESELTGTTKYSVKRTRTLVKAEIVQNGEHYHFQMDWLAYKVGIDGREDRNYWFGSYDENGACLVTQSNGNLTANSDRDFKLGERNEVTFWLSDKDSAINPDGSFKKVVVRLTYNDGVKTTVFEEELQPEK